MLVAGCEAFVGLRGSPIGGSLKKKEKEVEEKEEEDKGAEGPACPLPSSLLSQDVNQEKGTLEHLEKRGCLCETQHLATKWDGSHDSIVTYLDFFPLNLFQD